MIKKLFNKSLSMSLKLNPKVYWGYRGMVTDFARLRDDKEWVLRMWDNNKNKGGAW